jgi:hypothetical protein
MVLAGQILAAAVVWAAGPGADVATTPAVRPLTVCLTAPADRSVAEATAIAARMFHAIGVRVDWQRNPDSCPLDGVRMAMWRQTPKVISPGAFGRAFPAGGIRADVFLDRVRLAVPDAYVSAVAGHVLAHEIAHLLQADRRHAAHGLMKPRWDPGELDQMPWTPLRFTDADVRLIHRGLAERAARLALLSPASPEPSSLRQPASPQPPSSPSLAPA